MTGWAPVLLIVLGVGCSGGLSPGECDDVVDRMIDIFTAPAAAEPTKDQVKAIDDWRAKLKDKNASKQHMVDMCRKTMTSSHASCVKEAKDERSLATCFGG
jgi:hypothetical protein